MLFFLGFEMGVYLLIGVFVGRQMIQQINMPAFRALQADLVVAEKRGLEFGNVQMFFNLGAVIGPIIGGILYDHFRYDSWNIAGITTYGIEVIMIITTIIAFFSAMVTLLFVKKEDFVVSPKIPVQPDIEIVSAVIEGE
jgi:MFS family permease